MKAAWLDAVAAGTPLETELAIRGADGSFRTFLARAVPIRDTEGTVVQWIGTHTDVHALKQTEASLRASEASLKQAQRIAGLGNWTWDLESGELRWSDEIFRLFGTSPDAFDGTYASFLRGVHPDDRERIDRAVQDALGGIAPYRVEHRTLAPDGTVRVLLEQGEVTRDADGRPVQMAGTALDVTRQRLAEFHLAETNRALRLLSACNEAVNRSQQEDELLETVCRIAVEQGGFRMAWVGYGGDHRARTVSPRAHAGVESGFLAEIRERLVECRRLRTEPVRPSDPGGRPSRRSRRARGSQLRAVA